MRKKTRILILTGVLLLLALFIILDQTVLVTTRYNVEITNLPESFDGFRIVLLSDLHGAEFGKNNLRLVKRTASESPDIIALTGDFVCTEGDGEIFSSLLSKLTEVAPCYYVSGNHEWAYHLMGVTNEILSECHAENLSNRYIILEKGEQRLCLAGAEDPNALAGTRKPQKLVEEIRETEGELPVIFLQHRNDALKKYPFLDVDIILCGHAHGGIIRIPGIGGLLDRGGLFPDYDSGVYRNNRFSMVVSRGLGSTHGIPRILNFPEIVVVTLISVK